MKKADEAAALRQATQQTSALSRHLESSDDGADDNDSVDEDDRAAHDTRADSDSDGPDEDMMVVGGLAERARLIVYDPEELKRDRDYHRRLFGPLVERLAHIGPLARRLREARMRVAEPVVQAPAIAPPPPPLHPVSTPLRASSEQDVRDGLHRIQRLVSELVALFEVLTMHLVPAEGAPARQARMAYYVPVARRLVELAEARPLLAIQASDLARLVAVVFLDVLATSMQAEDSHGNRLFAWVADPWLSWCKREGRLVQLLMQFDSWNRAKKKPYHDRITQPTRKRKRRDSTGREFVVSAVQDACPVGPAARAALEGLSKTTMSALLLAAGNISHQGNAMREALRQRAQSPIGLYALIHSELLNTPV
jgi:hypothetical protein